MRLYVREQALEGELIAAVVTQKIDLWDLDMENVLDSNISRFGDRLLPMNNSRFYKVSV